MDRSNLKNPVNDVKKLLKDFKNQTSLKMNNIENVIENESIMFENGKIIPRRFDIKLPNSIIGDISKLNEEDQRKYINILNNTTRFNDKGIVVGVGIIDQNNFDKIVNNVDDKSSKDLNVVNQTIAKYILSSNPGHKYLNVPALDLLACYLGKKDFAKAFIDGTLTKKIKESIGKIYEERRATLSPTSTNNIPSLTDIKKSYGKNIGENLSVDNKFKEVVKLLAEEQKGNINSGFKAKQMIEAGFIYCEKISDFRDHKEFYGF